MRCGGVGGEEDRKRGNEEKREHGRDEDPEREEATKTRSTSGSSRSNRHWILSLTPKKRCFGNCMEQSQIQGFEESELKKLIICLC